MATVNSRQVIVRTFMNGCLEITLWDNDIPRMAEIERNLHQAMRVLGLHGQVNFMSEPPLLARMGMLNEVPVLEIGGLYWKHGANRTISPEACEALLLHVTAGKQP